MDDRRFGPAASSAPGGSRGIRGLFHGVQLWVNLPRTQKLATPRYQDLRASQVGLATTSDAGALIRVIAGDVGGISGPGSTTTPISMAHVSVSKGPR